MHNIRRPIRYELFKELDTDSQKEYITYLVTRYNVTLKVIAQMLGIHKNTASKAIDNIGCMSLFARGRRMTGAQLDEFGAFLCGERELCTESEDGDVNDSADNGRDVEVIAVDPMVAAVAAKNAMRKFSLIYDGEVDLDAMTKQLNAFIGCSNISRLEISCELC